MSSIKVYAAGGAGINVAKQLTDLDIDVNMIDTSESNLKACGTNNVFLVDGLDGAGKNRKISYDNFKDISSDVLIKFKPSEQLNVVLSSVSGGSGSIIAPYLAKELIGQGFNTIVIGIESKKSLIEVDNASKTLQTYKSFSNNLKKCLNLYYISNPSRKDADEEAIHFINLLAVLVDKNRTEEFDNADLTSFLNFNTVTDNDPNMAIIEVTPNEESDNEKGSNIVSTILITKDKFSTIKHPTPEYLATCVVTDDDFRNQDIRMNTVIGDLGKILDDLASVSKELTDNKKVNKVKEVEITNANDDGVVL